MSSEIAPAAPDFWGEPESESLNAEDRDDAIEQILDEMDCPASELPEKVIIAGFSRMEVTNISFLLPLEIILERLDEEYGDPDRELTEPTDAMREAEGAFLDVIKREYKPWACKEVCREEIIVADWIREHRPDWLKERA
jgi:hypothetical protein